MSNIPRFTIIDGQEYPDPEGQWAFINDALAAVAAAENHHDPGTRCDGCHSFGHDEGYKVGYGAAMDDGWGEPGHIKVAVDAERERIVTIIKTYYKVAPKVAVTLLNLIEGKDT